MKLNGTHQLLIYTDYVNILAGSVRTVEKNTDASVVVNEIGLEVNADKTKHMVMCRDKNAGKSHNIKIDNNSFESLEKFKYLGTTLMNQKSIRGEIKSRLKLGNACYNSEQDLLSSSLLSKNIKDSNIQNYNFACVVWV